MNRNCDESVEEMVDVFSIGRKVMVNRLNVLVHKRRDTHNGGTITGHYGTSRVVGFVDFMEHVESGGVACGRGEGTTDWGQVLGWVKGFEEELKILLNFLE